MRRSGRSRRSTGGLSGGRGVRRGAAALLTALSLAGCSATGGSGTLPAPPSPAAVPSAEPVQSTGTGLTWQDCGGGFQCGTLRVPLDHDRPDGEKIGISVIRLPATGERIGSVLLNPGGPGASGVDYARAAETVVSDEIRARFDIVGFDPRGVGRSTPVRCLSSEQLDAYFGLDTTPDTPAEEEALVEGARRFAAGCAATSGRLLPHVSTADAARDMDLLRAALGDEKLTYLGKSYGSHLGAVYADLFPDRVRALVLDGALDPSLDPFEVSTAQAKGFETAFAAFAADCARQADCPFPGDAQEGIERLMARIDREPLRNSLDDRQVTESWAWLGVAAALYDRRAWPLLRQALAQALRGDGSGLLPLADSLYGRGEDGSYNNLAEANKAVNCLDQPYPDDLAAYQEAAKRAAEAAPRFGAPIIWEALPCAHWPVAATGSARPLAAQGAPPILVVGTRRDPATPYAWAEALAEQLSSGVLVGHDGDGHTAYRTGSACVDRIVDRYLVDLEVPADGVQCPAE